MSAKRTALAVIAAAAAFEWRGGGGRVELHLTMVQLAAIIVAALEAWDDGAVGALEGGHASRLCRTDPCAFCSALDQVERIAGVKS
jgi:hypothetical protein